MQECQFEVFNSEGGWEFLFGKPLLHLFGIKQDFASDTVLLQALGPNKIEEVLPNQAGSRFKELAIVSGVSLTQGMEEQGTFTGGSLSDANPPSREVPSDKLQSNFETCNTDKKHHDL